MATFAALRHMPGGRQAANVDCNRALIMNAFAQKNAYSREELLECGHGRLFGPGNAQLPVPNMLMLD